MNYQRWFEKNTCSLNGKVIAITGATGGLGEPLCRHLAHLGADLILLARSQKKLDALTATLLAEYPDLSVRSILLDLEDIGVVRNAAEQLKTMRPDVLIHNAGAYSIPRHTTSLGVDNVFQINCLAPYYLTGEIMDALKDASGHVVIVGSIAHTYSVTDEMDVDFSTRRAASKVYGNAKRRFMLAEYERFEREKGISLSIVHPGITLTNITAHYPKLIFAVIKHPMKVIFMSPKKAALCIVKGLFESCEYGEWIGPRWFNIWGIPRKIKLKTFAKNEAITCYNKNQEMLAFIK